MVFRANSVIIDFLENKIDIQRNELCSDLFHIKVYLTPVATKCLTVGNIRS